MKLKSKQDLTVNILSAILLALLLLSGAYMWSQHNHFHGAGWFDQNLSHTMTHALWKEDVK